MNGLNARFTPDVIKAVAPETIYNFEIISARKVWRELQNLLIVAVLKLHAVPPLLNPHNGLGLLNLFSLCFPQRFEFRARLTIISCIFRLGNLFTENKDKLVTLYFIFIRKEC